MIVAFATTDGKFIDQHFGWSNSFHLYEVDKESCTFLKEIDSSREIEEEHEKLAYKIGCIEEAHMMYCSQIGPKASKMVLSAKIHPIRAAEEESIAEAVEKLQELLNSNPPPWLLRIYHSALKKSAQ